MFLIEILAPKFTNPLHPLGGELAVCNRGRFGESFQTQIKFLFTDISPHAPPLQIGYFQRNSENMKMAYTFAFPLRTPI